MDYRNLSGLQGHKWTTGTIADYSATTAMLLDDERVSRPRRGDCTALEYNIRCPEVLPSLSASSRRAALGPAAAEPAGPAGASRRRCRGGRTRRRAAAAQHGTCKEVNITQRCP